MDSSHRRAPDEEPEAAIRKVKVFLVDDHELVRQGLRHLLEEQDDLEVVDEAGSVAEALERVEKADPRVAILDVRLPDGNGIELCREIRSRMPGVACLILTSFADDEALFGAVMAGAAGFVLKEVSGRDLVGDIRRVAGGHSLIDPDLAQAVMERVKHGEGAALLDRLSGQEKRILDLVAQGLTNRQIADTMYLSEKTVKNYVSNLLNKLGFRHRTEAAVFAVRHGRG